MADKVKASNPNQLGELIAKYMKDYAEDVEEALESSMTEIGTQAVKDLKAKSPQKTGKYKRGWRVEWTKKRLGYEGKVYNSKRGQLTHLLEFGHPLVRNGRVVGQVKAQPHIAPVDDWINEELPRRFEQKLNQK